MQYPAIPNGLNLRQARDWAAQRPEAPPCPPVKGTLRPVWHTMWHLMSDGSLVTAAAMSAYIWDPWNLSVRPSTAKYLLDRAVGLGLLEKGWSPEHVTTYQRKVA